MRFDRHLLIGFLCADLFLIGLHAVFGFATLTGRVQNWPDFFNIGRDWSAGEILNYIKWVLITGVLIKAYATTSRPFFLCLAGFFFLCLLDDSLQFHENGTEWFIQNFDLYRHFGENQPIVAELMAVSLLGIVALGILALGWRSAHPEERTKALLALALFAGVVVCAVGVDALHAASDDRSMVAGLLGIVEDGGEMIFLTLLLSFVWEAFRHRAR